MRISLFYHSLLSDWNHGNAHYLRGIATELQARGHQVVVYEPADGWSLKNLIDEHGVAPIEEFHEFYPGLQSTCYDPAFIDLEKELEATDLVIVHEWNDPVLVKRIGQVRSRHEFTLLFHDTHHRLVTDRAAMENYDLEHYDGVLAYGGVLRDLYLGLGLTRRAWTWHEAADTRRFHPNPKSACEGDLVWIGNWGDGERTEELMEFLIRPAQALRISGRVHGVRYPIEARNSLAQAGLSYAGWIPNYRVPELFGRFKVTVHVPRKPYVKALPGIPTIRPFEALACGIPLICSPWEDVENLFTPGKDYWIAGTGFEMTELLRTLLASESTRGELAAHGLATIRARHTCAHRVDELLEIHAKLTRRVRRRARFEKAPSPQSPLTLPAPCHE